MTKRKTKMATPSEMDKYFKEFAAEMEEIERGFRSEELKLKRRIKRARS